MRTLRSIIGTFVSIGLLVGLLLSPAFAQPAFDPPGLARAIEAQERHTNDLLGIQGVVGTAVGLGANGQAVVKIYTEKSGVAGLPRSLNGVPVVVQVTGRIFALDKPVGGVHDHNDNDIEEVDPKSTFPRPVPIGVSSGSERIIKVNNQFFCTTGTLGARVSGTNGVYALSNAHVYAQEGSTTVDETGEEEPAQGGDGGDAILQPGRADVGCALRVDDQIGTLSAWEQIKFPALACDPLQGTYDPDCNVMDAAIALTDINDVGTATPSDGYGAPSLMTTSAFVGQAVQKYGRTTSLTLGTVDSINATVDVSYDNGTARFVDQIFIVGSNGSFSNSGDSGSLIVTQGDNKPVALLFAGNSIVTVGNPIDVVLAWFNVTIDGEAPPPSTAFTLSATGYKVKGLQKADLTWSGNTAVDIYRYDVSIGSNLTGGSYTDNIDNRGGGTYKYQACESGNTSKCSNKETVIF